MSRRNTRSKAVHNSGQKRVRRFGRKNPGLCLSCYEWVQHLYSVNGKDECYYCSRGIKRPS